jgi:hypothetical protein
VRKKKSKNCHIHIFHFQLVAKNIKGWLKICILLLVYSQIWLNLARADHHLGYMKNFLKKPLPSWLHSHMHIRTPFTCESPDLQWLGNRSVDLYVVTKREGLISLT